MEPKRAVVDLEKDYVDANMPIYFKFGIDKSFSNDQIQEATFKLVFRHPFLCSVISQDVFIASSNLLNIEEISPLSWVIFTFNPKTIGKIFSENASKSI